MKLGSSRGTDTRRPRGSERSKPRHKLRLTRPSQRPYPGPPEQAQPGVSEPRRTTYRSCTNLELINPTLSDPQFAAGKNFRRDDETRVKDMRFAHAGSAGAPHP